MDEIEGIDYTLDPMPVPGPDLDGWFLLHPQGRARFECVLIEDDDLGWVWAWSTLRRKPDRDY